MHRLPQGDINGDDNDDDVHNARMANGAVPRIRKNTDHAGFLVLFSPKKMMLVSDNEQLTLFPTCSIFFVRSFDFNDRNHLTYEDVLFGVAAMDLSTPHGGPSGELRCRYIFKFYSTEEEASLSFEEFK